MGQPKRLLKSVKTGLYTVSWEAYLFSGKEDQLITAEYLITVNIAKSIAKNLSGSPDGDYKVWLEHPTKTIVKDLTPLYKTLLKAKGILRDPSTLLPAKDTSRPGKADIAIYKETNSGPLPNCVIEVKGFNPSRKRTIDDLSRNLEYFNFTSNTGQSLLQLSMFVAIHSYKNNFQPSLESINAKKLRNRYKGYLKKGLTLGALKNKVLVFPLRQGILPPDEQEPEGDENYMFLGVIVLFYR